jgi:tRNA 2-selenouridine synthase
MIQKISIQEFIEQSQNEIVIDVRSPIEFLHAHIPNAINIPLFDDEQRKIVGTTYKQNSREAAIKIGLDFFGPKMKVIVEEVENKTKVLEKEKIKIAINDIANPTPTSHSPLLIIHCARGGMRSAAIAWLLNLYGFKVKLIIGGYKAYRNWVLQQFEKEYHFKILSGNTGSGKTKILQEMATNQSVVDLEGLANHKGSAFGSIGMPPQPSQEMFENMLATQLNFQCTTNKLQGEFGIWLEDESQRIGRNTIPHHIWKQMRLCKVYFINISFEERLQITIEDYGSLPKEELEKSIVNITKRLGGLETKTALEFLQNDDIKNCFDILLKYYDKQYRKGLEKRENLKENLIEITLQELLKK